MTAAQVDLVRTTVLSLLRDPGSAEFTSLSAATQPSGETLVCGAVNARNGFGGFAGAIPFNGKLYPDGNFYVVQVGESVASGRNVIALCEALGAKITFEPG